MNLAWMYWTTPTAIFFIGLALLISFMTVWDIVSPGTSRQGFLPIDTTRGARLFLSIILFFGLALLSMAFLPQLSLWYAVATGFVCALCIWLWG